MNNQFESTYALLVRCEERKRNGLEVLIYVLVMLSVIFSICYFVHQSVALPINMATKPDRVIAVQRG